MMHREGYKIVLPLGLAAIFFSVAALRLEHGWIAASLSAMLWLFTALSAFFFRDPERRTPQEVAVMVSPADGCVIGIDEVDESQFIQARTRRVSIFMSVWNVHVNRIPVPGIIRYLRYQRGRFHVASLPIASAENEQAIIGIESPWGRVLVKQIAGILARRVVCNLREGQQVQRGERFGIIRFGSRLEIFLPLSAEIRIRQGMKAKAGETIIAQANP